MEREDTRSLGVVALLGDHYVDGDDDGDDEPMAKISRRKRKAVPRAALASQAAENFGNQ